MAIGRSGAGSGSPARQLLRRTTCHLSPLLRFGSSHEREELAIRFIPLWPRGFGLRNRGYSCKLFFEFFEAEPKYLCARAVPPSGTLRWASPLRSVGSLDRLAIGREYSFRLPDGNSAALRDYHDRSKHSLASVWVSSRQLDCDKQPLRFKVYPDVPPIALPTDLSGSRPFVLDAIRVPRAALPPRSTASPPLDLSAGVLRRRRYAGGESLLLGRYL
jgi:hypothetical protein